MVYKPRYLIYALLIFLTGIFVVRYSQERIYTAGTQDYLNKLFTPIEDLDVYEEARPRLYGGTPKHKHAVLMIHGYSSSAEEFKLLTAKLKDAGIPYYAMLLTGFGRTDFRLLSQVEPEDWLYDGILAYDILATFAEEVSIVGHSTGGTIAVYIAQHRPVRHLVLSGPNLFPAPSDRKYRTISRTPILSDLIQWVLPVFEKPVRPGRVTNSDTLDPEIALTEFHYKTLPIQSLLAVWELQDMIDIGGANYQSLTLAYGDQDISVDVGELIAFLKENDIDFQEFSFANSAHNILQDYEKHVAVDAIFSVLKQ